MSEARFKTADYPTDFLGASANPFCGPKSVYYETSVLQVHKPFPTSNCCDRELVERQGQKLRWAYCRRCPHKIAPAPAPIYNDSRDGSAA